MSKAKHDQLYQDLQELKLSHIADHYREVLDEAARKNTTMLDWKWQSKKRPAWQPEKVIWQSKKRPLETGNSKI